MAWTNAPPDRQDEVRARAVDLLYEAAWEAARHLATDRARERTEIGLELAQGPLERARGLEILVTLDLWHDDGDAAWASGKEAVDLRVAANPSTEEDRRAIAAGCANVLAIPTRWPGIVRRLMTREEAAPYLELGMRHLPEGDSEERVRLLMAQGAWSWGFGEAVMEPAAVASDRAAAEEAVAMARRLGNAHLLSGALDTLGATGSLLSGYRGVLEPQWERLELVPQLEDAAEITDIYGVTAWGLAHLGNFREAEELGLRGLEVTERTGIVNYVPGAFAGVAQFRMADWSGFWETFHRVDGALDPERTLRYHAHRIYGVAAYVLEVTGDPEGADRIIARLDRSQADLGLVGVSGARSWIVGVLARRGEFAAARSRLAVVDPVREIQNRDLTHEAWADVIAAEGTWAEAAEIVRAARHWAEESGLRFLPAVADRLEGQAELATGLAERGATALQRARVTFIELEAAWDRARTELPLSRALQAIGRGQEAAEAARAALATFQEVGAVAEIAEAESILAEARA
jgi:tetratricopeptide (TPR) repeat protein